MIGLQLYQPYAEFMTYLSLHGKSYITMEEFEARRSLFEQSDELIKAHNSSESSFKLGHNQFSDWTDAEYAAILRLIEPKTHENEERRVQDFDKVSISTYLQSDDLPDYVNLVE